MSNPPRPTEAELDVLAALWGTGAATVREIYNVLAQRRRVQYCTVLKTLQIMKKKGVVERDETQRAHIYRAVRSREWTQCQLAGDLLERAFGGSTKALFVSTMSASQLTGHDLLELRKILDEYQAE